MRSATPECDGAGSQVWDHQHLSLIGQQTSMGSAIPGCDRAGRQIYDQRHLSVIEQGKCGMNNI